MEDRETARMRKYGESKTTLIMTTTVPRVTSGSGLRKFQADGFLLDRVYNINLWSVLAVFILLNWLTQFHPQRAMLWQFNVAGIHKT
jgi:hypothetical protein